MSIDLFLAVYLVGAIVLLGVLSVIAYRNQVKRGEIVEDEKENTTNK